MTKNRPLISASNKELDIKMNVIEGALPSDWYGHVYLNSPCGTVNSNGLPYPDGSHEQGSPIMNGDGYVYRIDLGPEVRLKTAIMKAPCYYADQATKVDNPNGFGSLYQFKNDGLTRMSLDLGCRDELNTAITPFMFAEDKAPRMLACYDAGRNWEIDVEDLSMITAIGGNEEYTFSTPEYLFPFPVIQSTAHPSFDPITKEMFIVNYTKSLHTMASHEVIVELLKKDFHGVQTFLEGVVDKLKKHDDHHSVGQALGNMLKKSHLLKDVEHKAANWLHGIFHHHKKRRDPPMKASTEAEGGDTTADNIYLIRWTGQPGPLNKWKVVDEHGESLKIFQCMHQTTISEDYIILADATFKFAFDLMVNTPFKSEKIDRWLRKYLTATQEPYLDIYLVDRRTLDPNSPTVVGRKLKEPIPLESVHFTADYKNPGGKITLHLAHNSAACLAEWVRTYDQKPPDGKEPINPDVIGLISTGCMDIGRIGKVVVDGPTAQIVSQAYIIEPGNTRDVDNVGVHTWGVGLYTFRDIISPDKVVDKIRYNYWSCYGMNPDLLTKFIYDLYSEYPNAIFTPREVLDITRKGIPFVLSRQNVSTMKQEDFYQFDKNVHLYSVQFVPRKPGAPQVTDDEQKDGYIFTTEVVNYPNSKGDDYHCEMWIFKAWDLASGPCCKLSHPDLNYAFTLHSAWIERVASAENIRYRINTREDYGPIIDALKPEIRQEPIRNLFEKHVYPHFDQ